MSIKFTPAAYTLTSTSPGPGFGVSISLILRAAHWATSYRAYCKSDGNVLEGLCRIVLIVGAKEDRFQLINEVERLGLTEIIIGVSS